MNYIQNEIEKRKIPNIPDFTIQNWPKIRLKIIDILLQEEYGLLPPSPVSIEANEIFYDNRFNAGKSPLHRITLTTHLNNQKTFSFPITVILPKLKTNCPLFIYISFNSNVPDQYCPAEEIIDRGYGIISFDYQTITPDNNDFLTGLPGVLWPDNNRPINSCGKIGLWSWACSRIMDYVQTLKNVDLSRITIIGHSRLGKTALLTGAIDERFFCTVSNDSGCSGAAISRDNLEDSEHIKDIISKFPYWFCDKYKDYINREKYLPFDQHFLLASIAPRHVYVASAKDDFWANPNMEYLCCCSVNNVFKKLTGNGFIHPDRYPKINDTFHNGQIGYHLRAGMHYLSREDWNIIINFLDKQN